MIRQNVYATTTGNIAFDTDTIKFLAKKSLFKIMYIITGLKRRRSAPAAIILEERAELAVYVTYPFRRLLVPFFM